MKIGSWMGVRPWPNFKPRSDRHGGVTATYMMMNSDIYSTVLTGHQDHP